MQLSRRPTLLEEQCFLKLAEEARVGNVYFQVDELVLQQVNLQAMVDAYNMAQSLIGSLPEAVAARGAQEKRIRDGVNEQLQRITFDLDKRRG